MSETNTVLVTGGSGYVAGWTIAQLLQQGYEVRATMRSASKADAVGAAVARHAPTTRLSFVEADLLDDLGWDTAMSGVRDVLHVASPLTGTDPETMVRTAVEGTERVIGAAQRAGVRRVVMTSSGAAATPVVPDGTVLTEADWTDPDQPGLPPYRRSKALSERAAWAMSEGSATELVTMLPSSIFGPAIGSDAGSSLEIFRRLVTGQLPALPRLAFQVVDVRDVAAAHLLALKNPDAAGRRFILSGPLWWFRDLARTLKQYLGHDADRVTTRAAPDALVRLIGRFNPEMGEMLPVLGRTTTHSSDAAHRDLGWTQRPAVETIVESGRWVVAHPSAR